MRAFASTVFTFAASILSCPANGQGLNVTAIAAVDGASVFQCWNLAAPAVVARGAANYPLGNSTDSFLGVIPPRTYIGQAFAPTVQVSIFLSGLAHITLPNTTASLGTTEVYMQGGKYGIIIAADTKNVSQFGHITEFPGDETTVIAQFPVPGNVVPPHSVLHPGGCTSEDLAGLN